MGSAGTQLSGMGGAADLKIHAPPHMCYHHKCGTSATKVYASIERNPQNSGALGSRPVWMEAWLTPYKQAPPHMCYRVNLVALGQRVYA